MWNRTTTLQPRSNCLHKRRLSLSLNRRNNCLHRGWLSLSLNRRNNCLHRGWLSLVLNFRTCWLLVSLGNSGDGCLDRSSLVRFPIVLVQLVTIKPNVCFFTTSHNTVLFLSWKTFYWLLCTVNAPAQHWKALQRCDHWWPRQKHPEEPPFPEPGRNTVCTDRNRIVGTRSVWTKGG